MASVDATQLQARRDEFRAFVWNHAADAFQAKFDIRAALTPEEQAFLTALLTTKNLADPGALAVAIKAALQKDVSRLRLLLQLAGLTRNKIIQDIKAFVRQESIDVSLSSPEAIFRSETGARLGSDYLAAQIHRVFGHAADRVCEPLLESVNQATWPGYVRQERAKRMGHEAEYRIACLLRDCGLPFDPEEKAENPLCRDVQIGGMSYDLVSPSKADARLRVVATVHTANIGQYGESKDDLEIRKALDAMQAAGDREGVTLLAFIDGVGFESNTAGLTGVLSNADEFCQFRTIWKAGVIAASKVGRKAVVALPKDQLKRFEPFLRKYGASAVDLASIADRKGWVEAGDGLVQVS